MVIDGHIHMTHGQGEQTREELLHAMRRAEVDGGVFLSPDPLGDGAACSPRQRLDMLLDLVGERPDFYGLYWVYPLDGDAGEQVDMALAAGVDGFKIICGDFYPGDERAMAVYRKIAAAGKPILFHSGILWDGRNSAKYNRPGEFECLLDVPGLRFTLAHVSWPWCDECIAVYGKFSNAYAHRPDLSCEMFIDITPGTPPLWREEVLGKLLRCGYEVEHNVIFGSDCNTAHYNHKWVREWVERDRGIFRQLGMDTDAFLDNIYRKNVLRFLGRSRETIQRKIPQVAV